MSKIEWTNATWNVVTGCTKYSEGCKNCYAEKMHRRLQAMGQYKYRLPFNRITFNGTALDVDFGKKPKLIFVNSMSDTFHEDITNFGIELILKRCEKNKQHQFQILTKRAKRVKKFSYPDNVWLGVTVEMAKYKDRIKFLKQTDAKIKFLSCEPLLEDLGELDLSGIDWVIAGGESGANARPCHADWVRNIQRQCAEQNVPFFFKQWGEYCPGSQVDWNLIKDKYSKKLHKLEGEDNYILLNVPIKDFCYKVGKKYSGCLLDGLEYKEYPRRVHEGNNS
mgnify:CR=1 FL=1